MNTYQGFSDDNVLIRGTLIQKYSNFKYYGGAVDGRRHGLGVLKTSTAKWEGVFEKGRFKNGYVERTFRDGSKYEVGGKTMKKMAKAPSPMSMVK